MNKHDSMVRCLDSEFNKSFIILWFHQLIGFFFCHLDRGGLLGPLNLIILQRKVTASHASGAHDRLCILMKLEWVVLLVDLVALHLTLPHSRPFFISWIVRRMSGLLWLNGGRDVIVVIIHRVDIARLEELVCVRLEGVAHHPGLRSGFPEDNQDHQAARDVDGQTDDQVCDCVEHISRFLRLGPKPSVAVDLYITLFIFWVPIENRDNLEELEDYIDDQVEDLSLLDQPDGFNLELLCFLLLIRYLLLGVDALFDIAEQDDDCELESQWEEAVDLKVTRFADSWRILLATHKLFIFTTFFFFLVVVRCLHAVFELENADRLGDPQEKHEENVDDEEQLEE